MSPHFRWFAPPALVLAGSLPAGAARYLTVDEAQNLMFPGASLTRSDVTLTPAQAKAISKACGVAVRRLTQAVWRVEGGGWFIVDEVLGKHEDITYALALDAAGRIKQIEILEYRESYGGEIRDPRWRQQFVGKTVASPLVLDADIQNITGATLSTRHVTDGVRRLLAFHALILR